MNQAYSNNSGLKNGPNDKNKQSSQQKHQNEEENQKYIYSEQFPSIQQDLRLKGSYWNLNEENIF